MSRAASSSWPALEHANAAWLTYSRIAWSNYGWGSEHVTITFDDAVRYMYVCYETGRDGTMTKKKTAFEFMVHQTTLEKLRPVCVDQETSEWTYLKKRLTKEF